MHAAIGLLILIGVAAFVVFAFRQGQGVKRDRREDDQSAVGVGRDGGLPPLATAADSGTVNEAAAVLPINAGACSYAARCRAASAAFIPCGATRARSSAG